MFVVKTKGVKRWTSPTYIYMCVCVCARARAFKLKKYIAAKYASARLLNVCGDVEIYEKLIFVNANFVRTNVLPIAISSPVLAVV